MPRIVRGKQRRAGENRTQSAFQNEGQHALEAPKKKKGKRPVSHRYNLLPLLPSGPDGFQRELTVRDSPFSGSQRRPRSEVPPGDVEKKVETPSGLRMHRQ